jgi:hypothetical protein
LCAFFYLESVLKTRFEIRKKLVFGLNLGFWLFFVLLDVNDWFKKVIRFEFLGVLG